MSWTTASNALDRFARRNQLSGVEVQLVDDQLVEAQIRNENKFVVRTDRSVMRMRALLAARDDIGTALMPDFLDFVTKHSIFTDWNTDNRPASILRADQHRAGLIGRQKAGTIIDGDRLPDRQ